jgi:hypothetical protein
VHANRALSVWNMVPHSGIRQIGRRSAQKNKALFSHLQIGGTSRPRVVGSILLSLAGAAGSTISELIYTGILWKLTRASDFSSPLIYPVRVELN